MKFDVVIVRQDGGRIEETFEMASDFLALCEVESQPDLLFDFGDKVVSATYGGDAVDLTNIETVIDLYIWMCGDNCNWFD